MNQYTMLLLAAIFTITLVHAALPNAPDGYAPQAGECPTERPAVRNAASLSSNETAWLAKRRPAAAEELSKLLQRIQIPNFDAAAYMEQHKGNTSAIPNIGLAFSGGGLRAMLNGAGVVQAFDARESNTTLPGHLGGLLQASTYVSGLSGGGWLVGSIYVNNFTRISDLTNGQTSTAWQLQNSIFQGPAQGRIQILNNAEYYNNIIHDVQAKEDAGFNTTATDYWSRALSYQFINATNGGAGYTWSSIQLQDSFSSASAPMPLIVADDRAHGTTLIPSNTTIFEFNPFEFGSWDPTTFGFVPLQYIGSNFSNGEVPATEECVRGFDNAGFVMGTTSSLFNVVLLASNRSAMNSLARSFLDHVIKAISGTDQDVADYTPNPFYKDSQPGSHKQPSAFSSSAMADVSSSRHLTLVDGGEDGQVIPLHPLIQPVRHVDVIIAVDSSADTANFWPNGSSLVKTYERSAVKDINAISNGTEFPAVPDVNTFVNLGLNNRPTFFGCNATNTSSTTPLIVYIPNAPYSYASNVSTFTESLSNEDRDALVENGYNLATRGNSTIDPNWPVCLACAILSRSLHRTRTTVPNACDACFSQYCWNGTIDSSMPSQPYSPNMILKSSTITSTSTSTSTTNKSTNSKKKSAGIALSSNPFLSILAGGSTVLYLAL